MNTYIGFMIVKMFCVMNKGCPKSSYIWNLMLKTFKVIQKKNYRWKKKIQVWKSKTYSKYKIKVYANCGYFRSFNSTTRACLSFEQFLAQCNWRWLSTYKISKFILDYMQVTHTQNAVVSQPLPKLQTLLLALISLFLMAAHYSNSKMKSINFHPLLYFFT